MKSIGEQAREFRESKDWNYTEMAKEVQKHYAEGTVNRQKIKQLEDAGDRQPQYFAALAKAMGTTMEVLKAGAWSARVDADQPSSGQVQGQSRVNLKDTLGHNGLAEHSNVVDGPAIRGRGKYPLISAVQAGDWTAIYDSFQPGDAEDWLPSPKDLGPSGFILRVKGPSMTNPDGGRESFPEGISLHIRPEEDAVPGDFVIAKRMADDEATFKKLVMVDGELFLHAINPNWPKPYIKLEPGDKIVGKLKFAGWDF